MADLATGFSPGHFQVVVGVYLVFWPYLNFLVNSGFLGTWNLFMYLVFVRVHLHLSR